MLWEIESTEWHLSPSAHEYTVRRAASFHVHRSLRCDVVNEGKHGAPIPLA